MTDVCAQLAGLVDSWPKQAFFDEAPADAPKSECLAGTTRRGHSVSVNVLALDEAGESLPFSLGEIPSGYHDATLVLVHASEMP